MQLDAPLGEAQARSGQVQTPHSGPAFAHLGHRFVPVVVEVGSPGRARAGVMLPEVLLVANLEPVILEGRHDGADRLQFAIGKHVTVDESTGAGRRRSDWPSDAVIE